MTSRKNSALDVSLDEYIATKFDQPASQGDAKRPTQSDMELEEDGGGNGDEAMEIAEESTSTVQISTQNVDGQPIRKFVTAEQKRGNQRHTTPSQQWRLKRDNRFTRRTGSDPLPNANRIVTLLNEDTKLANTVVDARQIINERIRTKRIAHRDKPTESLSQTSRPVITPPSSLQLQARVTAGTWRRLAPEPEMIKSVFSKFL